jgi:glutathione S-transferase
MAGLTLYYHPFASFCQKVLIALYENETQFTPHLVDLGDPASRDAFLAVWPIGRFPVLGDAGRGRIVPESSTIIEYMVVHYPGPSELIPADPEQALEVRFRDRFFDQYVDEPMQKIVTDRLRPPDGHDPVGVAAARELLATAYGLIETVMRDRTWAAGAHFSMADCAAAPALFYADWVQPFGESHPATAAYMARLRARPSFARVVEEARPYRHLFPAERQA